jgi:hypothetical protein
MRSRVCVMERKEVGQGRNLPSPVTLNLPDSPPTHRPPHSTMCGVHVGLAIFIPTANHTCSLVPDMAANILIRQPCFRAKPYTAFPLSLAQLVCRYSAWKHRSGCHTDRPSEWLLPAKLCAHRNSVRTRENEQRTDSQVLV